MTTATEKHTEQCPDCPTVIEAKGRLGALSRLRAHQRAEHQVGAVDAPVTSGHVRAAVEEGSQDEPAPPSESPSSPGPVIIESGFGPIEGGEDPPTDVSETAAPTVDTKVLLDGLYAHDKRGVLAWIHAKYPKPQNLMRDMNSVGLR